MTKAELMDCVGKYVEITFKDTVFSGDKCRGILGYTSEFSPKFGYRKPDYFTIHDVDFKVSHIKNCKVL